MLTATISPGGARRPARAVLPMLALLLLPLALPAVEVESLYTVQVRLDPRDPDAREAAYESALQQILIRITGSEQAALSPELHELFPNPARYVMQFQPAEDDTLKVTMDGDAIADIVRRTGYPVWGRDRPATILWLAVDWGQGDRELLAAAEPDAAVADAGRAARATELRERLLAVAEQRGVPLRFPPLAAEAFRDISFTDVWGGFHDRLLDASRRHGGNSILVGRLRPDVRERNRWSFYFGDEARQWSGEPEEAIHMLADTLAGQLAQSGNAPREAVTLTVSGIDSVAAYGEVQRLLAHLGAIDSFAIETVAGDRIRYRVEISGGAGRLSAALEFSGRLLRAATPPLYGGDAAALDYVYNP